MMQNTKVSVIIPVYNVEPYIKKSVDSVLTQTYKNLEIILVDDGSTDDSGKICDEYAKQDDRIQVIHQKNGGLSAARNAGLKIMTGDLIGFLDSDDWIDSDFFEILVQKQVETNADIVIIGYKYVYEKDGKIITSNDPLVNQSYNKEEALIALAKGKIESHVWDRIFKKQLFDGIEFPEGRNYEDVSIMYRLFLKAEHISSYNCYKYNYLQRNNSIIYTASNIFDAF